MVILTIHGLQAGTGGNMQTTDEQLLQDGDNRLAVPTIWRGGDDKWEAIKIPGKNTGNYDNMWTTNEQW